MQVFIDKNPLEVIVLRTKEEQARGFMGVKTPPEHGSGLLFIYSVPQSKISFWMKDVPFNLELLAFDRNGVLMQVSTLKANDHSPVAVKNGAMAIIETAPGFAKASRLEVGSSLLQFPQR